MNEHEEKFTVEVSNAEAVGAQGETTAEQANAAIDTAETVAAKPVAARNGGAKGNVRTFAEMLDDSLVTLHKGAIVRGTVISVVNGEVNVNLGFKSDGIIEKGNFSPNANVDPAETVKPGDEIEVYVIHVDDKDGRVLLSRKAVESRAGSAEVEKAAETGEPLPGKITEVVKGGVIANIKGVKAFVPSSQVSNRYIEDLSGLVGKEFNFTILQFDKAKRRVVAGRRDLVAKEIAAKKERVFGAIEEGSRLEGVVSRITGFGAFIDLGGVDGLAHISQLSWGRIKNVRSVLKEGDKVHVTVLTIDREKEKISLTLRDVDNDPWANIETKYPIGAIVSGRVVRLTGFGAFVELEPHLDGLVHISQISDERISKPEDALAVGDIIDVKVTAINNEERRISLSKKKADAEINSGDTSTEFLGDDGDFAADDFSAEDFEADGGDTLNDGATE